MIAASLEFASQCLPWVHLEWMTRRCTGLDRLLQIRRCPFGILQDGNIYIPSYLHQLPGRIPLL